MFAVAIGVGLIKRNHRRIGTTLVVGAVAAVITMMISGNPRPLAGVVGATAFVGGIIADEHGKRGMGLAGVSIGFFALMFAYLYT
jgi:hypothetical protein